MPYLIFLVQPFINNISQDLSSVLHKLGHKRVFYENEHIFAEGSPALFLPIVISGKVKMIHFLEAGKEVIIGIFQAGEMFAVPPVFDGKIYPSTAIAMTETQLLLLHRPQFLQLLRESSEFAFVVIEWMSEMLREKTATIHNLATASPEQRVGHVLLKLAEKELPGSSVRILLKREDIARIAGLTTETTIRVIRKLAAKHLLTIDRGKVVIDDRDLLKRHLES